MCVVAAIVTAGWVVLARPDEPAAAASSGPVTYEADCTTQAFPGVVTPFVQRVNADAAPDPSTPTGATFGASGTFTVTVPGSLLATLEALGVTGAGLDVDATVEAAAHATGTFHLTGTVASATWAGRSINAVVTDGTTAVVTSAEFVTNDVGKLIVGAGIPEGTTIVSVVAGVSATLSAPTTVAGTIVHAGTAPVAGVDYALPFSTGAVFTTSGAPDDLATLRLGSTGGFALTLGFVNIGYGAAFGIGACTQTGYTAAHVAGPAQAPALAPVLPDGAVTALVSATPPVVAPFAQVALHDTPPVALPQNVVMDIGATKAIALATTNDLTRAVAFEIVDPPSDSRLSATVPDPATGVVVLVDTGSGVAPIVTFSFRACDQQGDGGTVAYPPAVHCGAPATVKVAIGTQLPLADRLVLSCTPPEDYLAAPLGTGNDDPRLACDTVPLPAVQLDGVEHVVQAPGATLYVSDNRRDPTSGWTLGMQVIPTPVGSGVGENPNPSCAGIAALCNADVGSHVLGPNAVLPASRLSVSGIGCTPYGSNPSPAPIAGGGGDLSVPRVLCIAAPLASWGTFAATRTLSLSVPSSTYAGRYVGTIEYLVQ